MSDAPASIHASAVLIGDDAVLIRGPSGSGKSRLAVDLVLAGRARQIPATLLIADDRVVLRAADDGVIVEPVPALAGLLEVRGLGIRRCDHAAHGRVSLVIDLQAADAGRIPDADAFRTELCGRSIARLPVARDADALALLLAVILTEPAAPADGPRLPAAKS